MNTEQTTWTIEAIRDANKAQGGHFFDADTKRFFRSRIGHTVHQGPGGVYFTTSEQFVPSRGPAHARRYTVRRFDPDHPRSIVTAGEFQAYGSAKAANEAARWLAESVPFRATFTGREVGAIGVMQQFTVEVRGRNSEEATLRLYDTHEHISGLVLEPAEGSAE